MTPRSCGLWQAADCWTATDISMQSDATIFETATSRAGLISERPVQLNTCRVIPRPFKHIFCKKFWPRTAPANILWARALRTIFGEILSCVQIPVYWHHISDYSSDVFRALCWLVPGRSPPQSSPANKVTAHKYYRMFHSSRPQSG